MIFDYDYDLIMIMIFSFQMLVGMEVYGVFFILQLNHECFLD